MPNLWLPRASQFSHVNELPRLASGKMDLRQIRETALGLAAFVAGQRRLGSGPPVGWELIQATTSIYLGQALRSEAAQVFQRKGIPVPAP